MEPKGNFLPSEFFFKKYSTTIYINLELIEETFFFFFQFMVQDFEIKFCLDPATGRFCA